MLVIFNMINKLFISCFNNSLHQRKFLKFNNSLLQFFLNTYANNFFEIKF